LKGQRHEGQGLGTRFSEGTSQSFTRRLGAVKRTAGAWMR